MQKKEGLLARVSAHLDLPREALPGGFSILLWGDELCVRGEFRIRLYEEERILIAMGKRVLCIEGTELFCEELSVGCLRVIGNITGVFWKKEGESEA